MTTDRIFPPNRPSDPPPPATGGRLRRTLAAFLVACFATGVVGTALAQTPTPSDGDIRLQGGANTNEGRVEVYHEGAWGGVCDDQWDRTDGLVACRQLGYSNVAEIRTRQSLTTTEADFVLDDLRCTGMESRLYDCPNSGFGLHNCKANEAAGVVCTNQADTTAPTLRSTTVTGVTLTLTYSEALNENASSTPVVADFTVTVDDTEATVARVSVSGTTVTLTLAAAVMEGQTVTLTYRQGSMLIQDAAGNTAAAVSDRAVTNTTPAADTTAPTLRSTTVTGVTLTLTYSEALNENASSTPVVADFTVTVDDTEATVARVSVSGTTVTLTLAAAVMEGQTVTLTYRQGSMLIQDAAGNTAAAVSDRAVTNTTPAADTTAPTLRSTTVTGVTLTLTYSEALNENASSTPVVADFTVTVDDTEATVARVSVSGTTVTLTLAAAVMEGQTVTLTYRQGSMLIQDAAGNTAAAVSDRAVTNTTPAADTTAPTLQSTTVTGVTLTLTYSEALNENASSTPVVADFTVTVDDTEATVARVSVSGTTVTLTLAAAVMEGQTVTLTYRQGSMLIQDAAGNTAAAVSDRAVTNTTPAADTTAPTLQSTTVTGVTLTLTYSEALNENASSTPVVADFTVTVDDTEATVARVSVSGTTVTLTLAAAVMEGQTVTLTYRQGSMLIQDAAGNTAAAVSDRAVTNTTPAADTTAPTLQSTTVTGVTLTLTYSEALNENASSTPVVADFTVTVDDTEATVARVSVSGTTVTLTLAAAVMEGQTVTLTYRQGSMLIQDAAGNTAAAVSSRPVTNTTPAADIPQAWLARFGRTVATHVVDAVGERLRGSPERGSHVTVGGYRLPLGDTSSGAAEPEALRSGLAGLALGPGIAPRGSAAGSGGSWKNRRGDDRRAGADPRRGQPRTLNLRDILVGSSFRLTLGADDADPARARWTAWGRVAATRFDGRDGALALEGDVLTGLLGVDGAWDRWLAGVAMSHSRGDGSYTMTGAGGSGDLDNALTSIHPYLRYTVTDRLDVWGLLGYGWGDLTLEQKRVAALETDTDLLMGALGGRGILLSASETEGFELATRADAMFTRMTSDAVEGLESAEADAHRLRLILEGSRGFAWAGGQVLTPSVQLGLRHDWGDAETGFGLEMGGQVRYVDPGRGLTVEGAVRGLLAHEDSDYEEWGAWGTVRVDPGAAGLGLSLTLAPTWGAASSGVEGLWSRQDTAGLGPPGRTRAPGGRLGVEMGYGLAALSGRGLVTPYAGVTLSDGDSRTWRLGTRWTLGPSSAIGFEGTRRETANDDEPEQGLMLRASFRW